MRNNKHVDHSVKIMVIYSISWINEQYDKSDVEKVIIQTAFFCNKYSLLKTVEWQIPHTMLRYWKYGCIIVKYKLIQINGVNFCSNVADDTDVLGIFVWWLIYQHSTLTSDYWLMITPRNLAVDTLSIFTLSILKVS